MVLTVDGQTYHVDLSSISARLTNAKDAARRFYSVSPSGYGIHWPEIDEDLTVAGLIASVRLAESKSAATPALLCEQPPEENTPSNAPIIRERLKDL